MAGKVPNPLEQTPSRLILVVDDEPRMIRFIRMNLELEGYQVTEARNGLQALEQVRQHLPDLIIMDVMMPEMDGFETLRLLREISTVPVILLTVKSDEEDRIHGLELGADDYVTKPFSPRELVARVKAALRRLQVASGSSAERSVLSFRHVKVDVGAHVVTVDESPIELTSIEFELLKALAENHGRVLSREQLLEKVWGGDYFGEIRVVDVHLGHVRQKLGNEELITTVRGVGYRFDDEPL